MSITSKPILQEYKNAFHMFHNQKQSSNSVFLQFSPQKNIKKQSQNRSQHSLFGGSPLSRYFKDSQITNNKSKSSLEGFGITIDDHGHLIIAQWKNNQIDGQYFLFKPNLIEQNDHSNLYSAICQYGHMKNGNLDGENYVYNISGTLAKAQFQQNKIIGKCYVIHSNKLFVANQSNQTNEIECQIVSFTDKQSNIEKGQNSNILKIPKISNLPKNQINGSNQQVRYPTNFETIDATLFKKPNNFLEQLMVTSQQNQKLNQEIVYIPLNQNEYFIGFQEIDKKLQKQQNINISNDKFNGYGAIFKNQWPFSYGTYKYGKLQGLGRLYQTQMNLLDGYFSKGQLMQGFIIDYYTNTISFGHHSTLDPDYISQNQQQCFIITNNFNTISSQYIIQYKKNFHLKSLNFNNSYFNYPKIIHRSPWPYNIINKLNKRTHIQSIIKSFRPSLRDMEISSIQKIGQSTQNRLQKQLVQQIQDNNPGIHQEINNPILLTSKNNYIKNQIYKNLKKKGQRQDQKYQQKFITRYVHQYKQIQRKKAQIINSRRQTKLSQSSRQQTTTQRQKKHIKQKNQKNQPKQIYQNRSVRQNRQPRQIRQNRQIFPEKKPQKINQNEYKQQVNQQSFGGPNNQNQKKLTPTNKKVLILDQNFEKPQDLTDLVIQYHLCQTQRKMSKSGHLTNRNNTDRKISPREIYSKRSLIQQDYNHFRANDLKQKQRPTNQNKSNRRKVNLDLIYQQYLHK